jgi:uncharacterized protein YeaO (DUF488 family)
MVEGMSEREPRWSLATACYATFRPDLGVPVRTSVGSPRRFVPHEYVADLAPYGVFKNKALEAQGRQAKYDAYVKRLDDHREAIEVRLDDLTEAYGGETLVLLCYEKNADECHRRWAAGWFEMRYGIEVPEVGRRRSGGGGSGAALFVQQGMFDLPPFAVAE